MNIYISIIKIVDVNMSKDSEFLNNYFTVIEDKIKIILLRPEKEVLTYDILDTDKLRLNKLISLKEKHRVMKIDEIWQEVLGNYNECVNLKIGNKNGLDIISHNRKFVIELKNRTNTDNFSSRNYNFDKLAEFKKNNPEYTCIYATINDNTKDKTLKGSIKKFIHKGVEIEHQTGYIFLKFILGDNTEIVLEKVKQIIEKYT